MSATTFVHQPLLNSEDRNKHFLEPIINLSNGCKRTDPGEIHPEIYLDCLFTTLAIKEKNIKKAHAKIFVNIFE